MIPIPAGWLARRAGDVLMMAPAGDAGGFIRYVSRVRPLSSLTAITTRLLAGVEVLDLGDPELCETDEGEYAARLSAVVRADDRVVHREIGLVLVDDFYAVIDAHVIDAGRLDLYRSTVDRLVRADAHHLGERRRWYRHEPPAGWRAIHRDGETAWVPVGGQKAITVWHAAPRQAGASAETAAAALFTQDAEACYTLIDSSPETDVCSDHGLCGTRIRVRGWFPGLPVTERLLVALEDRTYVYVLKLEVAGELTAADVAVFDRLVASIRPLPDRRAADAAGLMHWAA